MFTMSVDTGMGDDAVGLTMAAVSARSNAPIIPPMAQAKMDQPALGLESEKDDDREIGNMRRSIGNGNKDEAETTPHWCRGYDQLNGSLYLWSKG